MLFVICKRIEFVSGVEVFVVFAVATLDFTVMTRGKGTNQLMQDLTLFEARLKQRKVAGRRAAAAVVRSARVLRGAQNSGSIRCA